MIEIPSRMLEFISGFQFMVGSSLIVLFVAYLVRKVRESGIKMTPELKIAWALSVIFTGDTIVRGAVWWARHRLNNSDPLPAETWPGTFTNIAAVATIIWCWGGLCILRVITPMNRGEWPWIVILVVAVVISALVAF